jgi:hypothetical protein
VFWATDVAYALQMGTRPQTLYGIADSPVGLAAWIIDHDSASHELIARIFDGHDEGLNRRRHAQGGLWCLVFLQLLRTVLRPGNA